MSSAAVRTGRVSMPTVLCGLCWVHVYSFECLGARAQQKETAATHFTTQQAVPLRRRTDHVAEHDVAKDVAVRRAQPRGGRRRRRRHLEHEHAAAVGAERAQHLRRREHDAERRALDAAVREQLLDDAAHRVDRHRVAAGARSTAAAARIRRRDRDADRAAARVEQRAAAVAGVDRRVGRDRALERPQPCPHLAPEAADDARRQRVLEAPGVADDVDRLADAQPRAAAERHRPQRLGARARQRELQHGDVARGVGADDARRRGRRVGERHLDLGRAAHRVRRDDDVAGAVPDEAGPLARRHAADVERQKVVHAAHVADVDDRRARRLEERDDAPLRRQQVVVGRRRGGGGGGRAVGVARRGTRGVARLGLLLLLLLRVLLLLLRLLLRLR